eukprot:TRINITY_DN7380_c0_g1_i1.p1 TRINITY_DN7380_c0_g1~~TRINITY_DN7380_c0_g1_i1.p1  ORF type:complete len:390 (-),score=101.98 TRINITY_DN7380_c0_g1_i1:1013-2053(-)
MGTLNRELNMYDPAQTTWKLTPENKWVLFRNEVSNPLLSALAKDKENKNKDTKDFVYYSKKISEENSSTRQKTPIFTPLGWGETQEYKEGGIISVKVGEETVDIARSEVSFVISVQITIIGDDNVREIKTSIPTCLNSESLFSFLEGLVNDDKLSAIRVVLKGKEVARGTESLQAIGIEPDSHLHVLYSTAKPRVAKRFPDSSTGWGYSSSVDAISFKPDKDIRLVGFGIYTSDQGECLSVIAELYKGNSDEGTPLIRRALTVYRDDSYKDGKVYRFLFGRQIICRKNEQMTVVLRTENGRSYHGINGNSGVNEDDVTFAFSGVEITDNGTSTNNGQLPELYFYKM